MGMIYCTPIAHNPIQTLMFPMGITYCIQSHANIDVPNGDDLLHTIQCKHWCAQWGWFIAHFTTNQH